MGVLAALFVETIALGVHPARLFQPRPLLFGMAGGLLVEVGFAAAPEGANRLWAAGAVRQASIVLALCGGGLLAVRLGPRVFAVILGGLTTYFVVFGLVLAGVLPAPERWLGRS